MGPEGREIAAGRPRQHGEHQTTGPHGKRIKIMQSRAGCVALFGGLIRERGCDFMQNLF